MAIVSQGKKLPPDATSEDGEVTDEDEGAESERKKSNKKVDIKCQTVLFVFLLFHYYYYY